MSISSAVAPEAVDDARGCLHPCYLRIKRCETNARRVVPRGQTEPVDVVVTVTGRTAERAAGMAASTRALAAEGFAVERYALPTAMSAR